VKGQSNLEIAGIPRNIFWYVVLRICKLVQHWILCPLWTWLGGRDGSINRIGYLTDSQTFIVWESNLGMVYS